MMNLYALLQVRPHASLTEIKSAYRRLARAVHPDSGGNQVAFVKLKEAYEVLSDEQKRTEYDQLRREWARRQGAYLCGSCGTANTVPRRPTPTEQIVCTACNAPLPLDIETAVALQKQRLVAEAARVVDDVGVELATTAIDVAKSGLARLRKRWTGSK